MRSAAGPDAVIPGMGTRARHRLILLFALAAPAIARAQLLSPGQLARSHAAIDSETSCGSCHLEGKRLSQDLCLRCHEKVGKALSESRGYHAHLIRSSGKPCEACHPDHQGREFALIRWDPQKNNFHHEDTGWPLRGATKRPIAASVTSSRTIAT